MVKNRIITFLCFILLTNTSQVNTFPIVEFIAVATKCAPVLVKASVAVGTVIFGFVADKIVNGPKHRQKEQQKIQDHQAHLHQVSSWLSDDFAKHLKRVSNSSELNEIPSTCLFEHYSYYRFPGTIKRF